ncbi:MAG: alpha-2-macroglobulin family protein, partial [Candidatus Edwardsbacteria bacterium]|nr:alpha-2-macroglobulin family protein [Candidatus Edwardsbacteria bacterium]
AKGELAAWSFRAPRGVSSVYVGALLVRSGGNYLVQRGLGIQRVNIRPRSQKLSLAVEAPEKMKPGTDLEITVRSQGKYKATIAVVDEGILQITDFQTPDPYQHLLRNLGLTMKAAESFGWIIRKFLDKTGGDFAAREKEFPQARFARIVSNWSGLRTADENGLIHYRVKVPEYNGKLRVMVAGAGTESFGSAQASVTVKSDVVVSPTIPRFMYTSDEFTFPITLINTTKQERSVALSIKLTNCSQTEPVKTDIVLKAEEKQVVMIPCRAGQEPGGLSIDVTAQSRGERYHDLFQMPVYPNTPYVTESQFVIVKPHQKLDLKQHFDDWYPRAHHADLMLSPVLGITRLNHARYLVRYPYGCIEQSSTSTMVLLRLSPLWQMISPGVSRERYLDMVNSGIHRLMSMQTASGGFSYWPGESDPCEWGSAYATFVLMEAKAAGFTVPAGVISNALDYLDGLPEKPGMASYVLAKGKRLQKSPETIDRLITLAKKGQYNLQEMLMVAGAVFESGRTAEAKNILTLALQNKADRSRHHSGDFYSYMQYRGMQLYFIEHINPGIPEEITLVTELADDLAGHSYHYSTQDLSWNMLALGLYAERNAKQDITVDLRLDGKTAVPQFANGIWSWRLENPGKSGSARLETNCEREMYLSIDNTGFSRSKTSFSASANGISVDRDIMDYGGSPITHSTQGQLVVILITADGQGSYENCAIEAQIPAGLEIENPRLGRGDLPAWAKEDKLWDPDYVDIRDDRVMIFGRIDARRPRYYYILARAVTPGKYFLPPVNAMVMYEPDYNSHTDAGTFEIKQR